MIQLLSRIKYSLVLGLAFTVVLACEKVIEVPINEEDKKIVFEGVLKDRDTTSYFIVSKTSSIYEDSDFDLISGASITVTDENGVDYIFEDDPNQAGRYIHPTFKAEENMYYYLTAEIEGQTLTSASYSKTKPEINSLSYQEFTYGQGPDQQTFLLPEYYSKDPIDEQNNYRLRIWINGEEENQYYIGNDFYINGETYDAQFFGASAQVGDTVEVEMMEMDAAVYKYFYGLSNTLSTGTFSPAPANPPSNIQGDVLGYFGVFMTDTMTMIVQ